MKTFILTQPVPEAFLKPLQDVVLLIARSWVAWVFFKAGVLKFQSWDVAVMLFEYEYSVPVFDPFMAALIATMIELTEIQRVLIIYKHIYLRFNTQLRVVD
jgi:uncharacterized membrane protein YphA (DoxX/SURF4 family)